MAKFVHVTADRVESGMRRHGELVAADPALAEEQKQLEHDEKEARKRRDREHAESSRDKGHGGL